MKEWVIEGKKSCKKREIPKKNGENICKEKSKKSKYEFVHQKFEQKQSTHTTEKKKTLC